MVENPQYRRLSIAGRVLVLFGLILIVVSIICRIKVEHIGRVRTNIYFFGKSIGNMSSHDIYMIIFIVCLIIGISLILTSFYYFSKRNKTDKYIEIYKSNTFQSVVCSFCGFTNPLGTSHCSNCGKSIPDVEKRAL